MAGLPEALRISPKALRHAFGAHLLANGADLSSVQAMFGHAEMGTMAMYAGAMADERTVTVGKHPLGESKVRPHKSSEKLEGSVDGISPP